MVLEAMTSALRAEKQPGFMFFYGFLCACIGLVLSMWIFEGQTSLVMVFLTTMASIPLVYNIIKLEEKKDLAGLGEKSLLKEHAKAIEVFLFYFVGATFGFAFCYLMIPETQLMRIFEIQTNTILSLRSNTIVTGNAISKFGTFSVILSNNLKVLIFCIIFSFLYGLGAIFILTWNASVIGVAIGDTIRTGIASIGKAFHITTAHHYIGEISYGLLRYWPHGILEIGAYFVAGLAGGIISTAAIRHDFGTKKYVNIVMDSSLLLLLSLGLLIVAAWVEVYLTPLMF